MKIFHTADWHIGKVVNGISMLDDQKFVLDQFVADVKREKPDVVIIAGDLYDTAVPSAAAVELLDNVLVDLVIRNSTPVIAIAGNHDSPKRIAYAADIVKAAGLHIVGPLSAEMKPVVLNDEHVEVHFHLVPYADPVAVRELFDAPEVKTHDEAMQVIVERLRATMKPGVRHVLIGHAFVTPDGKAADNTSDSEKKLSVVGGAEHVNASHFAGFDYVALGHLHRAHDVGKAREVGQAHVRYSGSILKYSLSEANHKKGYSVVELQAGGSVQISDVPLVPVRDVKVVEGTIAEIERMTKSDDYVFVTLLDEEYVVNFVERVHSVFPNAMNVERKKAREQFLLTQHSSGQRTKMSTIELFHSFFEEIMEQKPSDKMVEIFEDVLRSLERKGREDE